MKQHTMIRSTVFVLSSMTLGCFLGGAPVTSHARGYGYYSGYGYYPDYNPTVRRDYYSNGGYEPDGTYYSEEVEEDRHASYYSPGRNQAITRPRTTVESWREEPGQQTTRERTSWIGADGKPHSTTIESNTTTDPDGNSHTDMRVILKRAKRPAQ
jgi:hypothetical protein